TVTIPQRVREAKRAVRRAFQAQLKGLGFSLVEVLSTCPTRWGRPPQEAMAWLDENMVAYYPLEEFRAAEGLSEVK
ncbi:MAG: 2-oxoglutarate oxidoreductase, partial [Armatimonadetes bacterium]|nr:2-oxoglutarate oxidoreductase [Armatimonadota bacterium]